MADITRDAARRAGEAASQLLSSKSPESSDSEGAYSSGEWVESQTQTGASKAFKRFGGDVQTALNDMSKSFEDSTRRAGLNTATPLANPGAVADTSGASKATGEAAQQASAAITPSGAAAPAGKTIASATASDTAKTQAVPGAPAAGGAALGAQEVMLQLACLLAVRLFSLAGQHVSSCWCCSVPACWQKHVNIECTGWCTLYVLHALSALCTCCALSSLLPHQT